MLVLPILSTPAENGTLRKWHRCQKKNLSTECLCQQTCHVCCFPLHPAGWGVAVTGEGLTHSPQPHSKAHTRGKRIIWPVRGVKGLYVLAVILFLARPTTLDEKGYSQWNLLLKIHSEQVLWLQTNALVLLRRDMSSSCLLQELLQQKTGVNRTSPAIPTNVFNHCLCSLWFKVNFSWSWKAQP